MLDALKPGGDFVVANAQPRREVKHCGGVTAYLPAPTDEISPYYKDLTLRQAPPLGRVPARLRSRRERGLSAAPTRQTPVQLRVAVGDIVAARASLIAVGHVNGLRPDGAERALDAALDGAISRRAAAGALDGPLGSAQFVPAAATRVAADDALVVSLGDPGRLELERLHELGAAMVDAAVAVRARSWPPSSTGPACSGSRCRPLHARWRRA